MYYYLYQNIKNLGNYQKALFYADTGVRRRILRNMRRQYVRNIILRLREYDQKDILIISFFFLDLKIFIIAGPGDLRSLSFGK